MHIDILASVWLANASYEYNNNSQYEICILII